MRSVAAGAAGVDEVAVVGDLDVRGELFTRRPTMKPAICAGVSSPRMICRMTCSISSWNTSRCSTVRWMASATVICFTSSSLAGNSAACGGRAP
jgi:hypothetical protein